MGRERVETSALLIAVCICVLLGGVFAAFSAFRGSQKTSIELDGRINPNDAPMASLIRLPGIGFSKASAIVEYRREARGAGTGDVFENCGDMQKVKGIGPKTAESMGPHLRFE